mmetsp:Transcript_130079/g.277871  ORF Transcript_130079/g.277871 Transcript_130079/m.277871 type:complete len:220 (+) Transcript_130079:846-1505(+)
MDRQGIGSCAGSPQVFAERTRPGRPFGAFRALRADQGDPEAVLVRRGLQSRLLPHRDVAPCSGFLLLDHAPQHCRARHGLGFYAGRRWSHCGGLAHVPHGCAAREGWCLPDRDGWAFRREHYARLAVRTLLEQYHDRCLQGHCYHGSHHAHRSDLPPLRGGEADGRPAQPPGPGGRRPLVQRDRCVRSAFVAPGGHADLHLSCRTAQVQAAARRGEEGS